jgi:hypothetical protein
LAVKVKLVLLVIEATVPIAVPPWVPIIEPTESSVVKEVPEPVTVVEFVAEVTVPVRLVLAAVQVPVALHLPVLDAVLCAETLVVKNSKAINALIAY